MSAVHVYPAPAPMDGYPAPVIYEGADGFGGCCVAADGAVWTAAIRRTTHRRERYDYRTDTMVDAGTVTGVTVDGEWVPASETFVRSRRLWLESLVQEHRDRLYAELAAAEAEVARIRAELAVCEAAPAAPVPAPAPAAPVPAPAPAAPVPAVVQSADGTWCVVRPSRRCEGMWSVEWFGDDGDWVPAGQWHDAEWYARRALADTRYHGNRCDWLAKSPSPADVQEVLHA